MSGSLPSLAARVASRAIYLYLTFFPIQRGKDFLWRTAAKRFLVSQLEEGPWIRTSGLTEAEKMLFLHEAKEPRSVKFVRDLLNPGMVAIDVGANIGYFSLICASRVGSTGCVHAFEPTAALAERLRMNLALNGFLNVRVNAIAVADAVGTALLQLSADDPEANSLFQIEGKTSQVSVPTISLDAYAAGATLDKVDFLKIDCEGSELNVLRGAKYLLMREHAPVILVEFNPETLKSCGATVADLSAYFFAVSYKCYELEQLRREPAPVWNVLAVKAHHSCARLLIERYGLPKFTEFRS